MGNCSHRNHRSSHPGAVLWLFDPVVLEEEKGQGWKEGLERSSRSEECAVVGVLDERKGGHFGCDLFKVIKLKCFFTL